MHNPHSLLSLVAFNILFQQISDWKWKSFNYFSNICKSCAILNFKSLIYNQYNSTSWLSLSTSWTLPAIRFWRVISHILIWESHTPLQCREFLKFPLFYRTFFFSFGKLFLLQTPWFDDEMVIERNERSIWRHFNSERIPRPFLKGHLENIEIERKR